MTISTIEMRFALPVKTAQKLRQLAEARGVTEEVVLAQALDMLFELDELPTVQDYQFSIAAMREDWDTMPDDWIADEVEHDLPTR